MFLPKMYMQSIPYVTSTPFLNIGSLSILSGHGQKNPVRVYKKGNWVSVKWLNTELTKV